METLTLEREINIDDLDDAIECGDFGKLDIINGDKCDDDYGKPTRPDPPPPIPESNCISKP